MTFKESYLLLFLFSLLYWKHIDLWPSNRGTQGTANFVYCYETGLVSLVTNIAQQCVHIYENKRLSEGKECHGRQRSGVFSPQSVVFIHHTTSKSAITLTPRTNSSEKNRGSNNFWTQLNQTRPNLSGPCTKYSNITKKLSIVSYFTYVPCLQTSVGKWQNILLLYSCLCLSFYIYLDDISPDNYTIFSSYHGCIPSNHLYKCQVVKKNNHFLWHYKSLTSFCPIIT